MVIGKTASCHVILYSVLHSGVNFSEHMTVSIDFSLKHMWHSWVEMEEEGGGSR